MANETDTERQLLQHQIRLTQADHTLKALFSRDSDRAARLTFEAPHLTADFSKQHIDSSSLSVLLRLAEEKNLQQAISNLFAGQQVNNTEQRAALHMALRGHIPSAAPKVAEEIKRTQQQMADFVNAVHNGAWLGQDGGAITNIVNIGIGGSDLGPAMVTAALQDYLNPGITCHFVSNVDPAQIDSVLAGLTPESTLFIIVSKSFGTLETMQNAERAMAWFKAHGGSNEPISRHFVAVTTNLPAAVSFGISEDNVFPMWDWVGGRYSLWSAAGIAIALATSWQTFVDLLAGAAAMDQLDMESLGKQVTRDGVSVQQDTGAIIWGCAGTNGQHSFHQLLHQGTTLIPTEFIAIACPARADRWEPHQHLLANCFAQSRALMTGKSTEEVEAEMLAAGASTEEIKRLAAHKVVPGNRPSTTLLLGRLTPQSLGSLLAYYEAKVFVQSAIWQITESPDCQQTVNGKKLRHTGNNK